MEPDGYVSLNGERTDVRRLIAEESFYAEFGSYLVGVLGRSPETAKAYISMGQMAANRLGKHVLKVTSDDLISLITDAGWAPATNRSLVVAYHQLDEFAAMKHYGSRNWLETEFWFVGKGGKKRRVPVHPEVAKLRDEILSKPPSSKTSAGVIFGRLRDRLDLRDTEGKPATPHTLRRTFATTLYAGGTPWERVGTLLGHDIGVGDSYVQVGEELFRQDVERVEYRSGEPEQLALF